MNTEQVLTAFRMRFPKDIQGNLVIAFACNALDENEYKIIVEAPEKPYTILEEAIGRVKGEEITFQFTKIIGKTNKQVARINEINNL